MPTQSRGHGTLAIREFREAHPYPKRAMPTALRGHEGKLEAGSTGSLGKT